MKRIEEDLKIERKERDWEYQIIIWIIYGTQMIKWKK